MSAVRPRRVNGLAPPFTAAQISTWIFLPLLVLEFCVFVSPLLPLAASIPCTLAFGFFAISSTVFGYLAMKIDPKDPRLNHHHHNNNQQGEMNEATHNGSTPTWDPNEPTKQCWICDVQVGEKSMHCKFCNKCVDHFDHHCMWLNTCVGKANYHYFFRCMVSIAIMLVIQVVIQIALILDIYLGNGSTKQRAEDWFQANATIAVVIVMGVFIFFNLGALSLIGQLLVFHMNLQRKGLSTYQFIVEDNRRRREKATKEDEIKLRRDMAVAHATNEGKKCLAFRLKVGGMTRGNCIFDHCDPLKMDGDDDKDEAEKAPHLENNGMTNGNGHTLTISNETSEPLADEVEDDGDTPKETENV